MQLLSSNVEQPMQLLSSNVEQPMQLPLCVCGVWDPTDDACVAIPDDFDMAFSAHVILIVISCLTRMWRASHACARACRTS